MSLSSQVPLAEFLRLGRHSTLREVHEQAILDLLGELAFVLAYDDLLHPGDTVRLAILTVEGTLGR